MRDVRAKIGLAGHLTGDLPAVISHPVWCPMTFFGQVESVFLDKSRPKLQMFNFSNSLLKNTQCLITKILIKEVLGFE